MSALVVSSTTVGRWIVRAEHRDCWGIVYRAVHTGTEQLTSMFMNQRGARRAARALNRSARP